MKYWFDTEFHEDGRTETLRLISIGIVAEDGREYYAENSEIDLEICNDWVKANVIPHLRGPKLTRKEIASDILEFVKDDKKPEFWGYFSDYDWVLFAQLFGRMVDLPWRFPHMCMDVRQLAYHHYVKDKPPAIGTQHDALDDARWTRAYHEYVLNSVEARNKSP